MHLLRQALPHADCCLHCEHQALFWEPHVPYSLDVAEFEAALQAGALREAVALYRGDLLPECYADWIVPERERLRCLYISALDRLTQQAEEARDYRAALEYAQRLAREEPLNEVHCRSLMRLQLLIGDRAGALRAYHACAAVLRRELGVEPAPATQQLYAQALRGGRPPATALAPAGPDLPLIGRGQEWAQLLALWQSAAGGRPQLVLITGDVGIGKTRLAEELLTWADRQGYPAAHAACYAAEGNLPYAPIVAWLRSRPLPPLPGPWRRELARPLPDVGPGPVETDAPWERYRLFEALAHAVLAWGRGLAADPRPILLVLDDLPWCDRDTLDWLHFLLRFDPRGRLLIVATARSEDLSADQPSAQLLHSLRRRGLVTEIELAGLSSAETMALASQVASRSLPPDLAGPLYQGSEGNPLFVVEMVRAGLERSGTWDAAHGAAAPAAGLPLPPKLQQVLQARLGQLSADALALAELIAVAGRPCRYELLARAHDGDEASLVQALDELWRRRILRETGEDSYEFTHPRLREVCCEGMSAARRRLAQRRMAQAEGANRRKAAILHLPISGAAGRLHPATDSARLP